MSANLITLADEKGLFEAPIEQVFRMRTALIKGHGASIRAEFSIRAISDEP